jgi:hypothetical protein
LAPGLILAFRNNLSQLLHLDLLSDSSWFQTALTLQVTLLGLGTLGSYFLAKRLNKHPLSGLITALLYSFLPSLVWVFPQTWQLPWGTFVPWHISGSLTTSDLSSTLAVSLLPWSLLVVISTLPKNDHQPHGVASSSRRSSGLLTMTRLSLQTLLLALTTLILIFTTPSILPSFLVFLTLYLLITRQPARVWHQALYALFLGFIASWFWYSPRFWLHLLTSPSLGGQPLWQVTTFLLQYLGTLIILGWGFIKWKKIISASWQIRWPSAAFVLFLLLTLIRFLKDPDFWLDYTAWAPELDLTIALIVGGLIVHSSRRILLTVAVLAIALGQCWRLYHQSSNWASNSLNQSEGQILTWTARHIETTSDRRHPELDSGSPAISKSSKPAQRIFASGTPVPWLSSLGNISQLRGARDVAALHPFWAEAAYQLRNSDSGTLSRYWLQALGISHLIVHDFTSREFWHDFDYPEKFANLSGFQLLNQSQGDFWYQLPQSSLARATNLELLNLSSPQSGVDADSLETYTNLLGDNLTSSWISPNQLIVSDPSTASAISLAITSDSGWQANTLSQQPLPITTDPLGNLFIETPQGADQITLSRKTPTPPFAWYWPLLALLGCFFTQPALHFLSRKLPSLSLGLHQDDEDY